MNSTIDEIRLLFAETRISRAREIESLGKEYLGWVVRFPSCYGVAVPYEKDEPISERFHSVHLSTRELVIGEREVKCLCLTSEIEEYRNQFAYVCADFVESGRDGERRHRLVDNPLWWWERWTELLGNTVVNRAVHSLLGELMVIEKLMLRGSRGCRWRGVEFATHDIETDERAYEVKSTLKRYDNSVTISSHFQLETGNIPLSLILCRFEESNEGDSVDDVVHRLYALGLSERVIEEALGSLKFERGASARKRKFRLLEMREYEVSDTFPRITQSSFRDGKIPEAVIRITYTIDLSGIEYRSLLN